MIPWLHEGTLNIRNNKHEDAAAALLCFRTYSYHCTATSDRVSTLRLTVQRLLQNPRLTKSTSIGSK